MGSIVSAGNPQREVQRGRFEVERQQLKGQHSGDEGTVSELEFRSITLFISSKGTKGQCLNCSLEYYFSLQRDQMANLNVPLSSEMKWSFLDILRSRPG